MKTGSQINSTLFGIFCIRILQVMMLRAKCGRIKIRTNLLQRFDSNRTFGIVGKVIDCDAKVMGSNLVSHLDAFKAKSKRSRSSNFLVSSKIQIDALLKGYI